jgi:DNA-binding beta-propeller fold protein YncE
MRQRFLLGALVSAIVITAANGQPESQTGPYHVLRTARVGGEGGFDYVYADVAGRRLYVPRSGQTPPPRIAVYDLDTLQSVAEISGFNAHGAAVDPKSGHGFATSNPVVMWDTRTLQPIKSIEVQGGPDGILFDPFNARVYILSHRAPNMTVINAADGSVAGTIDLGGAPEQAVTDGAGHIYVDIEDKGQIAVVDARAMSVTARYDLGSATLAPAGLAFDVKNRILFAACRNPASMVILNADTGKILATLPIGTGVDGAVFNPNTMEAFSSQGDGTLTVVKESSPTSFAIEQTVQTQVGAKTLTLDGKTNRVLLIAAEYGPPPAPSQQPSPAGGRGGRGGRGPAIPGSFSILVVGRQ